LTEKLPGMRAYVFDFDNLYLIKIFYAFI